MAHMLKTQLECPWRLCSYLLFHGTTAEGLSTPLALEYAVKDRILNSRTLEQIQNYSKIFSYPCINSNNFSHNAQSTLGINVLLEE